MSKLSNRLNKANTRRLSTYEIVRAATSGGYRISQSTVARYLAGDHPRTPSLRALEALGYALGVPVEDLKADAAEPVKNTPFLLPPEANALNERQRAAIIGLIRAMVPDEEIKEQEPVPTELSEAELAPDGKEFNPGKYRDHAQLLARYGDKWREHYWDLAARRQVEGDDIDEPYQ